MGKYKFKRSETFRFRDGWIEKALNVMAENPDRNIFHKNDGIKALGVGSNMVKSIRYWLGALNLVDAEKKNTVSLSDKAHLLLENDKYLEDKFSWYYLHYQIANNEFEAPVFYFAFNKMEGKNIDKTVLLDKAYEYYAAWNDGSLNKDSVESDVTVFFQSYYAEEKEKKVSPEELTICPFSYLGLFSKSASDQLVRTEPSFNDLSHLLVYHSLFRAFNGKPFSIDDALTVEGGPCRVFNLTKSGLSQYLGRIRKDGLIDLNKAAGLNMIYFTSDKESDEWLFKTYFGSKE